MDESLILGDRTDKVAENCDLNGRSEPQGPVGQKREVHARQLQQMGRQRNPALQARGEKDLRLAGSRRGLAGFIGNRN